MKRPPPLELLIFAALGGLAIITVLVLELSDRPVLTPGPCTMLGIAELADHPGAPFLVIDCEGFQFGVPAVLP